MTRTARAAEDRRLLPGVAHARTEIAAVADERRDRLRQMMQVDDDIRDAFGDEPGENAADDRHAADRHRGFRAFECERTKAGAEARGQNQAVTDHQSASNSMSVAAI